MKTFNSKYSEIKIYHLCVALVLAGAINWGAMALGYNLVEIVVEKIKKVVDLGNVKLDTVIYMVIALSAVYLGSNRDFWLPFLGDSVLPAELVDIKQPAKFDTVIKVKVSPNSKVAYWAANPHETTPDVVSAYGNFNNSGVVMADNEGVAELRVIRGSGYKVPSGRYIKPHVHYRELTGEYGMMGPVLKVNYE